jgi:hypothetical protein
MGNEEPSGQQAVEPWQIVRASMVEQAGDDNPSRVARNILHALRNAGFTVSRTAAPTAPSTAAGEMAFVCGCGWEGSYADLNETAEGLTCPKCRLSRNMDCATTPPAQAKEAPTYDDGRDEAATFIFTELFEALGLEGFTIQDGSETWEGDVRATLMGILRDANVIDEETNERVTPPAPSAPWQEQAAQIRRDALEEAAKICDEMYVTFSSSMSPDRKNNKAWAMTANALADKIRALARSEKGDGK